MLVIGIDFDGTVVVHDYPRIGQQIGAVPWIKQAQDLGAKFVLNTMRSKEHLAEAVQWFEDNGIELWGVNRNPTQRSWTTSPKVYANLYIDDAALGCPLVIPDIDGFRPFVDWDIVGPMLIEICEQKKGKNNVS